MNMIDLLLILIILLSVWSGWQKGFILGAANLVTWAGSLLIGFFCYPYLAAFLDKHVTSLGVWTLPVAFVVTIILARVILSLILNPMLRNTPDRVHNSE